MNGKKLKKKWKMTIKEVLKKYNKVEIELLLAHILKKPKEFLYLHPEHKLTNKQFRNLVKYIRRREKGEPIAYILGCKDFMGLRLKVNKHTLIPRPETEEMVERLLAVIPEVLSASERLSGIQQGRLTGSRLSQSLGWDDTLRILDVGTGSGCIAISVSYFLKKTMWEKYTNVKKTHITVLASDVSIAALKVARANAKANKVKIKFIKSDLLTNVKGNFDIIVANLPYGWLKWKNNTSAETLGLKFEPKEALFTKENGLFEIRRLLEQISSLKYQPKFIYLEFDPRQKPELSKLIKKILPGYRAEFFKDLNNFWRFVKIKHSNILQNVRML